MEQRAILKQKIVLWVLIITSSPFFLFRLGELPLYDYDEAHYAEVVKDTLVAGDFSTFKLFGRDWIDKPPLLLWFTMVSVKLLGENEFALRFPTALFGVAAVLGVYLLTFYLTRNFWAAAGAGFILTFSGIFPAAARQLRFDVPLAGAIIFAVYSFIRGWKNPLWYLGFWVFTALGVLLRSFPALFIGPIILIFSFFYNRWEWLKSKYFWWGIPLFLAITAPWHILESLKFGRHFWDIYLGRQIVQRATEAILGGNVTNYDYLKHFILLNEPWFVLVLILIPLILAYYRVRKFSSLEYRLAIASFSAALFIFLAYAMAKTKLIFYLIPVFPFEAIAVSAGALFLFRVFPGRRKKLILITAGSAAFMLAAVSTSYQLFYSPIPYSYPFVYDERDIGQIIKIRNKGHTLYSLDWRAYDTIYYYSGQSSIKPVDRDNLKVGFPPPYFLIMPRPYFKNTEQPGVKTLFAGKYLVLLEANPEEIRR